MLTRRLSLGAAFLAGAALSALAQGGASKVEPKVRPAPDTVIPYRVVTNIAQSAEVMGMQQETKIERAEEFDCKVLSVEPDGSVKLEVKYGAIRGKMDVTGMGEFAFDSTKSDDGSANAMFGPALKNLIDKAGKTFQITVNPQGVVVAGDAQAVGRNPAFLLPLPKGAVEVGGSWEAVRERPMGKTKAVARGKCTLARVEGGVAELSFSGDLGEESPAPEKKDEAKKEDDAGMGGDAPRVSAPKGTLKTTMKLDLATGMAAESTEEADLKVTMEQGGQSVDLTIKATAKLERRKPEAPKPEEKK